MIPKIPVKIRWNTSTNSTKHCTSLTGQMRSILCGRKKEKFDPAETRESTQHFRKNCITLTIPVGEPPSLQRRTFLTILTRHRLIRLSETLKTTIPSAPSAGRMEWSIICGLSFRVSDIQNKWRAYSNIVSSLHARLRFSQ